MVFAGDERAARGNPSSTTMRIFGHPLGSDRVCNLVASGTLVAKRCLRHPSFGEFTGGFGANPPPASGSPLPTSPPIKWGASHTSCGSLPLRQPILIHDGGPSAHFVYCKRLLEWRWVEEPSAWAGRCAGGDP